MGCCSSNAVEKPSQNAKISFIKRRQGAVQDFYEILETLGKGSFGVVHQVRERKSKLVRAMKEVRKSSLSEGQEMQILNEIEILSQLDHPNIMKIYEVIESQQCYYIICELLIGGEVFIKLKHKGSFSEAVSASYIKDVLSGVYYSHSMGIVHNDLKPENLLLENKTEEAQLKIIDFGIARSLKHGPLTGLVGSVIPI